MNKYRNKKITFDGHKFDSKKEYERYLILREALEKKDISALELQKRHPLFVKNIKVASYVADFDYVLKNGQVVTEDVKSKMTAKLPVYRLKRKMFAAQYNRQILETF